jgi:hypothetical protein
VTALPHSSEESHATESGEGEIRGRGGWLPRGESLRPLNGERGTTGTRVDSGGAAAAWRRIGERGQRKPEGEGVN